MKQGWFVLILLLGISSCASTPNGGGASEAPYKKEVHRWTQEDRVYELFQTRILARATFKSAEYRQAFVDYYTDLYLLEPEQREALWDRHRQASERTEEFFLEVFTPDLHLNDLEAADPFWKIYLEDSSGERYKPIRIEIVDEPFQHIQAFYPYVSQWSRFYDVYFPKIATTDSLKLIVTSSMGRAELLFKPE
ncbi:MAG: hypothetical protein HY538_07665 [Deltaproteobacteria bacterium]|nr:hypothetical protein [Deltaproteobacteria bacterium]